MPEPYIRIVVEHEPLHDEKQGQTCVYHVRSIKINEPCVVRSDTGGVVNIEPAVPHPDLRITEEDW